jgi:hypothetical protein
LTIFAIETRLAQNRISGTFTLILTSVSFKWVTNRNVPTISYMTSLDKYQIVNIFYLVMCCVWHSICSTLDMEYEKKYILDKVVLCMFATFFLSIQVVFSIGLVIAYRRIIKLKQLEKKFLAQHNLYEQEEEEEEEEEFQSSDDSSDDEDKKKKKKDKKKK